MSLPRATDSITAARETRVGRMLTKFTGETKVRERLKSLETEDDDLS